MLILKPFVAFNWSTFKNGRFIIVRWRNQKQFKAKIAPIRSKKTASMLAMEHFDFYYGPSFAKQWPSIRLGLLTPNKFVAVLNRLAQNADTNEEFLRSLSTVDLVQQLTHGKPLAVERLERQREFFEKSGKNESFTTEEKFSSNHDMERIEQKELFSRTESGLETFRKSESEITYGDLQMGKDYIEANKKNNIRITGLEYIGQKLEKIDDVIYYSRELKLFTFLRDNISDFPAPMKDRSGISSWWLLDGGSVVPVLAMGIEKNDVVLDMCAAPGGKSLLMIQEGKFSKLVCNDSKQSRLGQLRRSLSMYVPVSSDLNNKIVLKRKDASQTESWDEEQVYDKVLLDAPCTTDRLSLSQDDYNIFAVGMTQERLNLPQLQTKLLINALRSVKAGGTVVYSTCTLSPTQNECVIENAAALVKEHFDIDVVEVSVSKLENHLRNTGLFRFSNKCSRGMLVVPHIRSNFGPMFVCKLMRRQ